MINIALLTDFGHKDTYVCEMKSVLLRDLPQANFLDISHQVSPFFVKEGIYYLERALPYLPQPIYLIAVVDPGVGTDRRIILIKDRSNIFIAPDNGLLSKIGLSNKAKAYCVKEELFVADRQSTFHGRDVMCKAFIKTIKNEADFLSQCEQMNEYVRVDVDPYVDQDSQELIGEVISIDHFGNVITNIRREHLISSNISRIRIDETVFCDEVSTHYGNREKKSYGYLFNSGGFFELFCSQKSAQEKFKIKCGQKVVVGFKHDFDR